MTNQSINRDTLRVTALYLLGVGVVMVLASAAHAVSPVSAMLSFALLISAVAINGWFGGFAPGIAATIVAVVMLAALKLPTASHTLAFALVGDFVILALGGTLLSCLCHSRHCLRDQLEDSLKQMDILLSDGGCGITIQDTSGKVTYANVAAAKLCGFYSPEALMKATQEEILSRFEIFDEFGDPFPLNSFPGQLALLGMIYPEALLRYRARQGSEERWAHLKSRPIKDKRGNVKRAINLIQDVTGIMQEHRSVEQYRDELLLVLHNVSDAVISIDTHGAITYMNDAASRLTGWNAENAITRSADELFPIVHADTGKILESPLQQVLAEKKPLTLSNSAAVFTRARVLRRIEGRIIPVLTSNKQLRGAILIWRDASRLRT